MKCRAAADCLHFSGIYGIIESVRKTACGNEVTERVAEQLIVDLYGCAPELLDDPEFVQSAARAAVQAVGAEIVEECMHRFEPIGISYIAVITTSHFSIHTWPEYGYAAVDIFSCSAGVPQETASALGDAFGASECRIRRIERDLKGEAKN